MVILDTNVLIDYPESLEKYNEVLVPTIVLEELDKLKNDRFIGGKVREAIRRLKVAKNLVFVPESDRCIPIGLDKTRNDNKIIGYSIEHRCELITNDIGMLLKARSLGLDVKEYGDDSRYTGFYEVVGTDNINKFYKDFENGEVTLHVNQYILLKDGKSEMELRFDGEKLVKLNLPPSDVMKGWNAKQRCALDLLNNDDIPIKILAGNAGSGKTQLAVSMAMYKTLKKCKYNHIEMVRNPLGSGEEIGFLTGGFEEKTSRFFQPIVDCIEDGEQVVETLLRDETLRKNVPFYMKGLTRHKTFMLVDEAEDLTLKILKLVGTRIGNESAIVFTGDYKQAENKFTSDNGLVQFIDATIDEDLVGVVVLDDNVRSSVSKVFSKL